VPLYDFRCRACGAEFEALVRPPQEPACSRCGSGDIEKLVTSFSFSVRSGGLSPAARRAVQKQQTAQRAVWAPPQGVDVRATVALRIAEAEGGGAWPVSTVGWWSRSSASWVRTQWWLTRSTSNSLRLT
jgi:putative FmdB family regulatory protein